ncbi:DNA primase, partial [Patescibacteria group bacterium]|nr:DNA primase [Patescibacteria group bacterium]
THKIILATNHKPVIHETTHAIWRRISLIPFNYVFEKKKQIKDYHEKLLEERDGILQWMLEGCLEWQSEGLGEPKEVEDATKDYKSDMDILGDFLADCCVIEQGAEVTNKTLREAYAGWCGKNGEKEITPKTFSTRLQERGFMKSRNLKTERGRGWKGIRVRD